MPVSFLGPARLRAASPSDAPEALSGLGRGALGRGEERRTQLRGGGGGQSTDAEEALRASPHQAAEPGGSSQRRRPRGKGMRPPGRVWKASRRRWLLGCVQKKKQEPCARARTGRLPPEAPAPEAPERSWSAFTVSGQAGPSQGLAGLSPQLLVSPRNSRCPPSLGPPPPCQGLQTQTRIRQGPRRF